MKSRKVEDYFNDQKTGYFSLLKSSKKWKEFLTEKESMVSFFVAIIFTVIVYAAFGTNLNEQTNELFRELSFNISLALIGLLGFTISGLAIFTGTITNKLVKDIDDDCKGANIINILYSFYFIGGIDAVEIILLFGVYLLTYTSFAFCICATYIIFFIISFLFLFIVLYSVSLLGTCINLFLVGYKYFLNRNEKNNE